MQSRTCNRTDESMRGAIKEEMKLSADLLRATGLRHWNLDATWLQHPAADGDADDRSESPRNSMDCDGGEGEPEADNGEASDTGMDECDGEPTESGHHLGDAAVARGEDLPQGEVRSYKVGQYVFFLADMAPFVMGKVIDTRDAGEEPQEEEVLVHWFTPANRGVREGAATQCIEKYAGGTFTPDFLLEKGPNGRRRRVPDSGWERSSSVVVACDCLIAGGRKISRSIIAALIQSRARQDAEEGIVA